MAFSTLMNPLTMEPSEIGDYSDLIEREFDQMMANLQAEVTLIHLLTTTMVKDHVTEASKPSLFSPNQTCYGFSQFSFPIDCFIVFDKY